MSPEPFFSDDVERRAKSTCVDRLFQVGRIFFCPRQEARIRKPRVKPVRGEDIADDIILGGEDSDQINAGHGKNLVLGDNGRITAALSDSNRFGSLPITLGLVETQHSLIGGSDVILVGDGDDIVLGGINEDVIAGSYDSQTDTYLPSEGNNIFLGDSGSIDWTAADHGGLLAGDDFDPRDLDRVLSTQTNHGSNDLILSGAGDDIIIAGEDGEIITENNNHDKFLSAAATDGDHVEAGDGNNIVLGDNGEILASSANNLNNNFVLGLLQSSPGTSLIGGSDSITTGNGSDIVVGGIDADQILAGDGNNIVIGDNGLIDWSAADRGLSASIHRECNPRNDQKRL